MGNRVSELANFVQKVVISVDFSPYSLWSTSSRISGLYKIGPFCYIISAQITFKTAIWMFVLQLLSYTFHKEFSLKILPIAHNYFPVAKKTFPFAFQMQDFFPYRNRIKVYQCWSGKFCVPCQSRLPQIFLICLQKVLCQLFSVLPILWSFAYLGWFIRQENYNDNSLQKYEVQYV